MSILICIVGFIIGVFILSLLFKIAIEELTVGHLLTSIMISTVAFLGLIGNNLINSVILTATPSISGILGIFVVKISESKWFDKKIF